MMTSQTVRYILAGASAGLLATGLIVQWTARAVGEITTASDIGLALTTAGAVSLAVTLPSAMHAMYHWAHDRGYVTQARDAARDAKMPPDEVPRVVRIDHRAK